MTAARSAAILAFATLLSACSSPEDRVALAAKYMNEAKSPMIDSARAEGSRLIVRYKEIPTGRLSDNELKLMMTAGICRIEKAKNFVDDGGAIRIELPRRFDYFAIDIDRCNV